MKSLARDFIFYSAGVDPGCSIWKVLTKKQQYVSVKIVKRDYERASAASSFVFKGKI